MYLYQNVFLIIIIGTCHCYPGFGSDICLVNLSRIIEVAYIFGDGYCDISMDGSCQDFIVESDGFVPEFSARVNVKEVLLFLSGVNISK